MMEKSYGLEMTGMMGNMTGRSAGRSTARSLSFDKRPASAPETAADRIERNERRPIRCPTTSNSAALTASFYRKRQPARVETRLFTRNMLTSDYPSRPQHTGYSMAEDLYDDEKRGSGRDIPNHKRPSQRRAEDRANNERARSATTSPQRRPKKGKDGITLGIMRSSLVFNDMAYLTNRIETPKLGDRPLGDCIWMAWKLGSVH
jgi:hypothetical protein